MDTSVPERRSSSDLLSTLQRCFGHSDFRPGQQQIMETLLEGRSALAVFPTGGGKSLCYQLPALLLEGMTLVISPLIALMKDQVEALRARGIPAARLDSTLSSDEVQNVLADMRNGRLKLLYTAPERLVNESFMKHLSGVPISLLAIDEAHCISEWGHNFRPEYLRLADVAKRMGWQLVLALTATATPEVAASVRNAFSIDETDHVQTSFFRSNLALSITPTSSAARLFLLAEKLQQPNRFPSVVYTTLQSTTEQVADYLSKQGIKARAYHAGLPDDYRAEVQEAFMNGEVEAIVATIAFGMGIDKADVRSVFHYNLPKSLENYQQETGRAGRDGQPAHCEMLACADDLTTLQNFFYGDTPTPQALQTLIHHLLRQGKEFEISRYELSHNVDIRPLVLETVLTRLELEGYLEPLGAGYAGCQVQFLHGEARALSGWPVEQQQLLKKLFDTGNRGYKWLTLDMNAAAEALVKPRSVLMNLLSEMEQAGDVILKLTGLRYRFRLTEKAVSGQVNVISRNMQHLFVEREERDAERLSEVLQFAATPSCLVRHLLHYFGENMTNDCGHCSSCLEHREEPRELPVSSVPSITASHIHQIQVVIEEGHAALRAPRQLARFLCGLTSPATTRARLSKHDAWGLLEGYPFQQVLAQTESMLR